MAGQLPGAGRDRHLRQPARRLAAHRGSGVTARGDAGDQQLRRLACRHRGARHDAGSLIQHLPGARGYEPGFALCGVLLVAGGLLGYWMIDPQCSLRYAAT